MKLFSSFKLISTFSLAVFLFLFISIISIPTSIIHASSSSTINARVNVFVLCPFKNNINSSSAVYIIPQPIDLIYSAETLQNCIVNLTGNIIIANNTNTMVYKKGIFFNNLNNIVQFKNLVLNSSGFKSGLYTALMQTNSSGLQNSSTTSFIVLTPANIIISNIEVSPQETARYSSITLIETVKNNGALSSSNMIALIKVTGPSSFSTIDTYAIPPLAGGASENISLALKGLTQYQGKYILNENISYYSSSYYNGRNYTYGPYISNNANTIYSVYIPYYQSSSGASGVSPIQEYPPPTPTIPTVSGYSILNFLTYPFMLALPAGSGIIKQIGLANPTNSTIVVNIRANQTKNVSVDLSSNIVIIPPHKSIYINALFNVSSNTAGELINIPLNFSISSNNKTYYSNGYTMLSVTAPTHLVNFTSGGDIVNSSKYYISINLNNPTNKTLKNITVSYPIPAIALNKTTNITLSGGVHIVNSSNNNYLLEWYVPELQPNSRSVLSGEISNISNFQYLGSIQPSIYVASQSAPLVKLLGVVAPPIYVNSSAFITATLLYSGVGRNNITLSLTGPIGINISQPITINAYPNEIIKERFNISPIGVAGTRYFVLHIRGSGINANYTIPLIVTNFYSSVQPTNAQIFSFIIFPIAYIIIFSIIIILLAYYSIKFSRKARYKPKRLNELKNIKESIEASQKPKSNKRKGE